ncbi:MAG: prolipoprotein diacylglyceryl transferase [candidate division Zixibacteria bacterium]|nr:prolipoprotein diacylglyceryl transferase [candidate division Zixibacteria bacterium]
MHPEIVKIGPVVIRAYGVMLFVSFLAGMLYVRAKARSKGIDPDFTINLSFLVIVAAVVGARLFYVFYHWSEFSGNLINIFNPFGSGGTIGIAGLNLYGGLIFAIGAGIIYTRMKKQPFLHTLDLFAPPIALGTFFTRIGCFLNGCCFGKQCDLPWGIHFPEGSIPYSVFGEHAIHPTQLYMSILGLTLFLALFYLDRRKHFPGMVFAVFLIAEAFIRFIIEFVRYYEGAMIPNLFGAELTYNHIVAFLLFVAGWVLFFYLRQHNRKSG